eukprot:Phypoly_transcript_23535.p1 GENE.Phypoly_transcript_23535~~Phypoly_transcript_23535.p1  ORF type:complete len:140 (-),score=14.92 Phypoly_transcript_23535:66-485(-)
MIKIIILAVLAIAIVAINAQQEDVLSIEAPLGFSSGNHSLRSFKSCTTCKSGTKCCCANINGIEQCMAETIFNVYCFDTSKWQCCPYVSNPAQLILACAHPNKCIANSTAPSGQSCVNSATSISLSAFALVVSVFVFML